MNLKIYFFYFVVVFSSAYGNKISNSFIQYPCSDNRYIFYHGEPGLYHEKKFLWTLNVNKKLEKGTKINMTIQKTNLLQFQVKWFDKYQIGDYETYIGQLNKTVNVLRIPMDLPTTTAPVIKSLQINDEEQCDSYDFLDKRQPNLFKDKAVRVYKRSTEESNHPVDESEECGVRKINKYTDLIVKGKPSKSGAWPWHVALLKSVGFQNLYVCGGTLISKLLILTAAHCVTDNGEPVSAEDITVVLGSNKLSDASNEEKEVNEIFIYPGYDYRSNENDIALLKFETPVTYKDNIQPACLWKPEFTDKFDSELNGTVAGWGIDETDIKTEDLQEATLPKIEPRKCLASNRQFFGARLYETNFCAGFRNGTSPCNGDSGGGFHVFLPDSPDDTSPNATGKWFVHGITSLAIARDTKHCDPNNYVLFTDVSNFLTWIKKKW